MRYTYWLLITAAVLLSCQPSNAGSKNKQKQTASQVFTLADAEKILGEKAHVNESKTTNKDGIAVYQSAYVADALDPVTGKTGNIYFMMEEYPEAKAAGEVYHSIMEANRPNGINELQGLGDEAYFHSDNTNFLFILARKGNKMIRMKVNKTTSHTSREAFDNTAKKIIEAI
jgi:hypothetical protein